MILSRLTQGSWLRATGQVADEQRSVLLPLIEAPEGNVLRGGNDLTAFELTFLTSTPELLASAQTLSARQFAVLLAAFPRQNERVEPLEDGHPCLDSIADRCAKLAGPVPRGFDQAIAHRFCARDLGLRNGMSDDLVLATWGLDPNETRESAIASFDRTRQSGLAVAGRVRDDVLDDYQQELARIDAANRAEQKKQAEEAKTTLYRDLLCLTREPPPRGTHGGQEVFMATLGMPFLPVGPSLFRDDGLPTGASGDLELGYGLAFSKAGPVPLTKAQRAESMRPVPESVNAMRLQAIMRNSVRFACCESDIDGDGRVFDRAWAMALMRAHLAILVPGLCVAMRGDGAVLAERAVYGIAIAYYPFVSVDDATFAICEALTNWVQRNRGNSYRSLGNGVHETEPEPYTWPQGIPEPSRVRERVVAETICATDEVESREPSVWMAGERVRPPTTAERRQVELQLDPGWVTSVVRKIVGDRKSISTKEIWASLNQEGVLDQPVPNSETRGAISILLETVFGFISKDKRKEGGGRERLWIKALPDVPIPVQPIEAPVAPEPLLDGFDEMRKQPVMQINPKLTNSEGVYDR